MRTFLNLFERSPFTALQVHMRAVAACVQLLPELFEAVEQQKTEALEKLCEHISSLEKKADIIRNDIRNDLPVGLFLAIDHSYLLEILSLQDQIADQAKDVAVLVSLKPLTLLESFKDHYQAFMTKNLEAFNTVQKIIEEIEELLEYSFGGLEAKKVKTMVEDVGIKEREADLLQRPLLKILYASENEMAFTTFSLWMKIIQATGAISDLSERLANRVRMTLEIK